MSQITKNALAASLKKLLSKKELSKITITNITEECGVNRQTFYYHFKDIYDLLEWIFTNEVIEEIENEKEENWQQKFIYVFEYAIKNKELIKNIYNSGSKEYFLKFVYKQTNLLIINFIEKEYKDKKLENKYHRYEVSNYSITSYESRHNLTYWKNNEYYGVEHFVIDLLYKEQEGVQRSGSRLADSGIWEIYKHHHETLIKNQFDAKIAAKDLEKAIQEMADEIKYEFILGLRLTNGINKDNFNKKYGINIKKLMRKTL
mgnify:CR=1 FL=1